MPKILVRRIALKAANLYLYRRLRYRFLLNLFTGRDPELDRLFEEVFSLALKKGFSVKKPEIRKVMRGFRDLRKIKRAQNFEEFHTIAEAITTNNIIIVFANHISDKKEDRLLMSVLLAHELGHIVDYKTKRVGHPLFDNIRHESSEMFADAFAAYLFSKMAVLKLRDTFVSHQFNVTRFSQLDLDC